MFRSGSAPEAVIASVTEPLLFFSLPSSLGPAKKLRGILTFTVASLLPITYSFRHRISRHRTRKRTSASQLADHSMPVSGAHFFLTGSGEGYLKVSSTK